MVTCRCALRCVALSTSRALRPFGETASEYKSAAAVRWREIPLSRFFAELRKSAERSPIQSRRRCGFLVEARYSRRYRARPKIPQARQLTEECSALPYSFSRLSPQSAFSAAPPSFESPSGQYLRPFRPSNSYAWSLLQNVYPDVARRIAKPLILRHNAPQR